MLLGVSLALALGGGLARCADAEHAGGVDAVRPCSPRVADKAVEPVPALPRLCRAAVVDSAGLIASGLGGVRPPLVDGSALAAGDDVGFRVGELFAHLRPFGTLRTQRSSAPAGPGNVATGGARPQRGRAKPVEREISNILSPQPGRRNGSSAPAGAVL